MGGPAPDPPERKPSTIENLTDEQRAAMLRFLLHRMDLDTRAVLMAERPVAYLRVYPSARDAVLQRVATATEP